MVEVPDTRPVPSPHAALSEAAEVYFSAIQKIGEQALQSSTSQILGEGLPSSTISPHTCLGLGGTPSPTSTPGLPLLARLQATLLPAWCLPLSWPALFPSLGPRGFPFIVLPLQEVPQRHRPCSSGPRVQTLPAGLLQGWDRRCEYQDNTGSPWTPVPKSSLREALWQLLAGTGQLGQALPTDTAVLCACR